jgi:hypothetical protein
MTRHAKRTDFNQKEIVDELRSRGVQTVLTNFGENFPDLLCGYMGDWTLIEVKQPDGSLDRGQLDWLSIARGRVGVATTPTEAVVLAIGPGISEVEKDRIAAWLIKNPTQQSLSVKKFRKLING